jgi:hypothetical protein
MSSPRSWMSRSTCRMACMIESNTSLNAAGGNPSTGREQSRMVMAYYSNSIDARITTNSMTKRRGRGGGPLGQRWECRSIDPSHSMHQPQHHHKKQ